MGVLHSRVLHGLLQSMTEWLCFYINRASKKNDCTITYINMNTNKYIRWHKYAYSFVVTHIFIYNFIHIELQSLIFLCIDRLPHSSRLIADPLLIWTHSYKRQSPHWLYRTENWKQYGTISTCGLSYIGVVPA